MALTQEQKDRMELLIQKYGVANVQAEAYKMVGDEREKSARSVMANIMMAILAITNEEAT